MDTISCGSASGVLRLGDDGIGTVAVSGLIVPSNFLALAVLSMRAAVERGAVALLYRNEAVAICSDPVSMTAAYPTLAPALRALPVALVINPTHAEIFARVVQRAGAAGLLRRAFLSEAEAREWVARAVQAVSGNRQWWAARRGALAESAGR